MSAKSSVRTLSDLVFRIREVSAGRPGLLTLAQGERLESLSATDFLSGVHSLALALEARGVAKGDRVAIYAESRPEWHTVDLACQLLGAATVPLNPALPPPQVGYILRNSGSRWVFYSDRDKREVLIALQGALTTSVHVVAIEGDATIAGGVSLTRLMGEGAERRGDVPIERFRGRVGEDELATILYTSGTTGDPKGVMLSHRSLVASFQACGEVFDLRPTDQAISFLPLSHGLQRTIDHLCFDRGTPIHYVPGRVDLSAALFERRPTVLVALPQVYERAYAELLRELAAQSRWRQRLFRWGIDVGRRYAQAARSGFIGPLLAANRRLASLLVYRRIRERFGGRLRFILSGGGALAPEVGDFFEAVGLPLYQGYGLAEIAPVLASNAPEHRRQGSVGKVLPQVEVRLAADGEILARGPGMMQGYWENPQATAELVDDSGWLHTGDVGRIDQSGYLFITDRKQDLLTLADGRTVAPLPIEKLLSAQGVVARAVVVGDGHPRLGALIVPDFAGLRAGLGGALTDREIARHPEVRRKVATLVATVNARLAEGGRLSRFELLEHDFSVAAGELTPTFKVRRKAITQRHAERIAALCAAP